MAENHYYDLLVLLDPEAPEERRSELVERIKGQIDSGEATLKGDADWGMRKLSFEIDHRREAQYHLFQFQAAPQVLTQLDRNLSIDDSVLRHRIIRLPGEPTETTPKPGEDTSRRPSDERAGARGDERSPAPDAETVVERAGEQSQAPPAEAEPGEASVGEAEPREASVGESEPVETSAADDEPGEAVPPDESA
jgi:small subunit ribosomal protein S6